MNKKIMAVVMALIMCFSSLPTVFAAENTAKAYVTLSEKGEIAEGEGKLMANIPVLLTDEDEDGKTTVNDVLITLHDDYCEGGYATGEGYYGISITKLWGDESGAYGYYLNNSSCWSVFDEVKDGDCLTAFIYKDAVGWSDAYTFFEKASGDYELTVKKSAYDEDFNPISVTLTEEEMDKLTFGVKEAEDNAFDYSEENYTVNAEAGTVTFNFDDEGEYIVTAKSDELIIVPPVYSFYADINSGGSEVTPPDENTPLWTRDDLDEIKEGLAQYFIDTNTDTVPGDWAIVNLALMGEDYVEEVLYDDEALQDYVVASISAMDKTSLSDCARVLIALTSIGIDGSNLSKYRAFYDKKDELVTSLVDEIVSLVEDDNVDYITAEIYAYMALMSGNYDVDDEVFYKLRESIIDCVDDTSAMRDTRFMAITALWKENDKDNLEDAFLDMVSSINESGVVGNSNTTAWAVICAASLGVDAEDIENENGKTLIDGLLYFITEDKTAGLNDNKTTNNMASRDVLTALISEDSTSDFSPYDFTDTESYDETDWAEIIGLELISKPSKTEYVRGEKLSLEGAKLKVIFDNGTEKEISATNKRVKVSGFDSGSSGKKTVTLTYGGLKVKFEVSVIRGNYHIGEISLKIYDPKGTTYYETEDFFIEEGDTPISILDSANVKYETEITEYGLYVVSIYNLGEGDKGHGSGWMVTVNDIFISTSAENVRLKDGDSVEWIYTRDYGKDIGGFGALPGFILKPEKPLEIKAEDVKEVTETTIKDIKESGNISEWSSIAFALSGEKDEAYIKKLIETVVKNKGILNERRYTEYSKTILALTLNGVDATDVEGYNLVDKLEDFDKVNAQGINGTIWALIALDSGNYGSEALRTKYLEKILASVKKDGGFGLGSGTDVDITAMAVTALSGYADDKRVKEIIDNAIDYLSRTQDATGGYTSWGDESSETVSQVIIALNSVGIDLLDERFVKEGKTLYDNLMGFKIKGGFKHTYADYRANAMATEQALLALVSMQLGGNIYSTDTKSLPFDDIALSPNKDAILSLYNRGILSGKGNKKFEPYAEMTRAEYITSIVNALGLAPTWEAIFTDAKAGDWYFSYIGAAYKAGLIVGDGTGKCNPNEKITAEQAAVIMAKAMSLSGKQEEGETSAHAVDTSSAWAKTYVDKCARGGIFENIVFDAKASVIRGYMAQMVYNLIAEGA